jgi:hypothetical protein
METDLIWQTPGLRFRFVGALVCAGGPGSLSTRFFHRDEFEFHLPVIANAAAPGHKDERN